MVTLSFRVLSHYQWSPHNRSPGPNVAAMDGPSGPCTAATLGPWGPSTALIITTIGPPSHGWSPTAGLFTGLAGCFSSPHYVKLGNTLLG